MAIRDSVREVIIPVLVSLREALEAMAEEWADLPMLARTHGQPATPTRLGKELAVFSERLDAELMTLMMTKYSGKFGGATGNLNAHKVAYPSVNWVEFANRLLNEQLGLERQQTTTQIEHYDGLAALFDNIRRINTFIIDLCRDVWSYISLDYFKQTIVKGRSGRQPCHIRLTRLTLKTVRETWVWPMRCSGISRQNCRFQGCSVT